MYVCLALVAACSCWWPFSDDSLEAAASPEPKPVQLESKTAVPFEMMSAEQKFLAQAQQFLDLPPLEKCQNQASLR